MTPSAPAFQIKPRTTPPRQSLNAAFSLIELLVVLAIISIVAALFLPALARSKTAARRVQCVQNLRQLGLAAQMYWHDHDSIAFAGTGARTNGGRVFWFGWIQDGAEGNREFDPAFGALHPYLQGRGIELCPAFDYTAPKLKLKANGVSFGYGYNYYLAPPNRPPWQISRLPQAADTVLFADAAQVNTWQSPASADNPLIEEWYFVDDNTTQPNGHFRHDDTLNAVFCDGHVDREEMAPGSLDQRLPGERIGALRKEIVRIAAP